MKKKILLALSMVVILTVLFAISISAASPVETWDVSATSRDNVTATLYSDYSLVISGTGNMKNWNLFSAVPWYSSYSSKIISVTIENGVTSIGDSAFYRCTGLTSVVIPEGVTSIGSWAFGNCTKLTSVVIPEGVTSIGDYAFYSCTSLTSVVIPDNVISMGGFAFYYCKSLTSVVIPDSVTSIGGYAFNGCTSLTSVVIGDSVTSIGSSAFKGCTRLTSITVDENNQAYKSIDGNLYTKDGKTLVQYAIGKTNTTFTIPESVTSIGNEAFSDCTSLTSVVIPESVTSIGRYAFEYCFSLTIYCEAETQPSGWSSDWNYSNRPVVWGYFDEEACLESVFTFKGYSFGFAGQIAVGYGIDYEAIAKYEAKTGKILEIGVLFAGFENLGGKQPLVEDGQAITLDAGKVVKADLTSFTYPIYDFVLTDIVDSIKDVKLVISAYIYNGEAVWYVQENGLSDTVSGISYNEAKESVKE